MEQCKVTIMDAHEVQRVLTESVAAIKQLTARAEKAEQELDNQRTRAIRAYQGHADELDRVIATTTPWTRADIAEHKVAMLEAEVGQAKARIDSLKVSLDNQRELNEHAVKALGELRAEYQLLLYGTAHGIKCWMDDCGWHCGEGCHQPSARLCTAAKDLADAREQLAKVEWLGPLRAGSDPAGLVCLAPTCLFCQGARVTGDADRFSSSVNIGHRQTCWYARQGKKERTALDPEAVKEVAKQDRAARVNDLLKSGRVFMGCDFGFNPGVTWWGVESWSPEGERITVKDGTAAVEYHPSADSSRPAPKFKVGQKVWHHKEPGHVVAHGPAQNYFIRIENGNADRLVAEDQFSDGPAPRFALGEWVTWGNNSGEVTRIPSQNTAGAWYEVSDASRCAHTVHENYLAAQTPAVQARLRGVRVSGEDEGV